MTSVLILAWLAKSSTFAGQSAMPVVTAEAAIAVHAESGRVLWGRNVDRPMYPASTTKLLTTLILLEETNPSDVIVAPEDVKSVRGSSLHLLPGEQISAEGAAYALMLRSANDVGYAIARKLGGSEDGFARKMNDYSAKLGMKNSHWVTPHGLNNDWHKTTARDMAKLASHARENAELVAITSTQKYTIQRSLNQKDTLLESKNKLLKEDPRIKGFKTGYTNPAGLCFVGYWQTGIGDVVTVVLNSWDWAADESVLANWAEKSFAERELSASTEISVARAKDDLKLSVRPKEPVRELASAEDAAGARLEVQGLAVTAPIDAGQGVGKGRLVLPDGTEFPVDLVAENSVERSFDLQEFLGNPVAIVLILLASGFYWYRRRSYERFEVG